MRQQRADEVYSFTYGDVPAEHRALAKPRMDASQRPVEDVPAEDDEHANHSHNPSPEPSCFESNEHRYAKKKVLLNKSECRLQQLLLEVLPSNTTLLALVRIADVLEPDASKLSDESAWNDALFKITHKHFDFVICSKTFMEPLCAIELDGPSHSEPERRERDDLVEKACASASLPLVRIKVGSPASEDAKELAKLLDKHFYVRNYYLRKLRAMRSRQAWRPRRLGG